MKENDYDQMEEFTTHVWNMLMFDLRSFTSLVSGCALAMQLVIDDMDETLTQNEDVQTLRDLSVMLSDTSQRMDGTINKFSDTTHVLTKKNAR